MNITIEIRDGLFRRTETSAAARGVTLQRFVTDALLAQLPPCVAEYGGGDAEPTWMAGFGGLSHLGDEHRRIRQTIKDEFGRLDAGDPV